ncbi:hypothetical protein BDR26DRAFT_872466 [Obelidium mucronatum]|nr:hypothetical protein BDR26DRAFT_872466 [Obelidium mucronatum]
MKTAERGASYCDVLRKDSSTADIVHDASWYISHSWSSDFLETIDSIQRFFDSRGYNRYKTIIWLDFFSSCPLQESRSDCFKAAANRIKTTGNMVLVLNSSVEPAVLKRAWCVFELWACHIANAKFHIAMTAETHEELLVSIRDDPRIFRNSVSRLHCEQSEATSISDRAKILEIIKTTTGFAAMDKLILSLFTSWIVKESTHEIAVAESLLPRASLQQSLSLLHMDTGDYASALLLQQQALRAFQQRLGPSLTTFKAMNQLAVIHMKLNNIKEAGELFTDSSNGVIKLGGPDSEVFAFEILLNMAAYFESLAEWPRVEKILEFIYTRHCNLFGIKDERTLGSMARLGLFHRDHGDIGRAESLLLENVELNQKLFGTDSLQAIEAMNSLAHLFVSRDRLRAVQLFTACIKHQKQTFGETHKTTLNSISSLGSLYLDLGMFKDAGEIYVNTFKLLVAEFGVDDLKTIYWFHQLAWCQYRSGNTSEAERMLMESIDRGNRLGHAQETLKAYIFLSEIKVFKNDHQSAARLLEECVSKSNDVLGPTHTFTKKAKVKMELLHEETKQSHHLPIRK